MPETGLYRRRFLELWSFVSSSCFGWTGEVYLDVNSGCHVEIHDGCRLHGTARFSGSC